MLEFSSLPEGFWEWSVCNRDRWDGDGKGGLVANTFQRRRMASQPKPIQDGHAERERRISRPAEILRSRSA